MGDRAILKILSVCARCRDFASFNPECCDSASRRSLVGRIADRLHRQQTLTTPLPPHTLCFVIEASGKLLFLVAIHLPPFSVLNLHGVAFNRDRVVLATHTQDRPDTISHATYPSSSCRALHYITIIALSPAQPHLPACPLTRGS